MNGESSSLERQDSRYTARISTSCSRDAKLFKRNPNLSHIVHALLHLSQFLTVLSIEAFHHVHHSINDIIREKNPNIPDLPEERHIIFIVVPFCMLISLILGTMWILSNKIDNKIELGLAGCTFGAILMLLNAIFSMRDAQLFINIEEISDDDLLQHPIFIHSFTVCILAIFALGLYLLHFWLFYECWRWQRKQNMLRDTMSKSSKDSRHQASSNSTESSTKRSDSDDSFSRDTSSENDQQSISPHDHNKIINVQDEPVILYCFCVDCCNYLTHRCSRENDVYQCEDTHVM